MVQLQLFRHPLIKPVAKNKTGKSPGGAVDGGAVGEVPSRRRAGVVGFVSRSIEVGERGPYRADARVGLGTVVCVK